MRAIAGGAAIALGAATTIVARQAELVGRPARWLFLTELGHTVTESLAAMRTWTEQHLPDDRAARRRFEELEPV